MSTLYAHNNNSVVIQHNSCCPTLIGNLQDRCKMCILHVLQLI